jgi:AAA15 family ATPase/GTPase
MNLKSFGIANFKAIGQPVQRIPIKPITLVFGPNSAGKSSLLHSMLWMNHAITHGELDVRFPIAGKNQIDLGGFTQMIHHHASTPRLIIEPAISKEAIPSSLQESFNIKEHIPS